MIQRILTRLNQSSDFGIVLLRVVIGVVFVMHGWQKLFVYGIPGVTNITPMTARLRTLALSI